MSLLIDRDGCVCLSPSKLTLLECLRRGRWYLQKPDERPNTHAVVGRAGHLVLASLARRGWPDDAFEVLPEVVDQALTREGLGFLLSSDDYYRERSALVEALRRFVTTWPLPLSPSALVEVQARLEDRVGRLRIYGRLDMLLPPNQPSGDHATVIDWKAGAEPQFQEEPPLAVIGQAALARASLGRRSPVVVRWVFVRSLTEQVWHFGQRELVDGFARVRELAANILVDRWPPRPGELCFRCPVADCEYHVDMPNAADLGLVEVEDTAE